MNPKSLIYYLQNALERWRANRYLRSKAARRSDPSQLGEAKIIGFIIKCLSKKSRHIPRTFLEIGANTPYRFSTSWYLEHSLGFRGISIDPNNEFAEQYLLHRKKTMFVGKALVPNDYNKPTVTLYLADCNTLSTLDPFEARTAQNMGFTFEDIICPAICYSDLEEYYQSGIGVLILDIESVDIQLKLLGEIVGSNLRPTIICVETIDFSPKSDNLRAKYDLILSPVYTFVAGSYLNSIYLLDSKST
jgi:hypothetical protein